MVSLALAVLGFALYRDKEFSKAPAPAEVQRIEAPAKPAFQGMSVAETQELMNRAEEARLADEKARAIAAENETKAKALEQQHAIEAAAREEEEAKARAVADAEADAKARLERAKAPVPVATTREDASADPADLLTTADITKRAGFIHPGLLHSEADFKRMRTHKGLEPWKGSWQKMVNGRHANLDWKPSPAEIVRRGGTDENYALFYRDIATAYVCAVCWQVTGKKDYAEKSIEILNAWSSTLKEVGGNYDKYLAAGIYGYEIANAAEIMRTYKGWKPEDFGRLQKMMLTVFYPMNKHFIDTHGDSPNKIDHFWPNWELCNLASMISIGVLCDERKIYNEAVKYMKTGDGNGAIKVAVYYIHPDGLGQWVEAARDQGHTLMGIGLMGAICEVAWKQGDDLYGYDNNRFLAACEYVAKYNLGEEVPFKKYVNSVQGTFTKPGEGARGAGRPVWDLPYNHYVKLKGLPAPWLTKMAAKERPEGGVGDYGPNSGGYDQLGFGTFTATLDNNEAAKPLRR